MDFRGEAGPIRGNAEQNIIRSQERSVNISDIAKGYKNKVEELMKETSAPAIRNEVQKYTDAISSSSGPEQREKLEQLVKALEPYKKIVFGDILDDKEEKTALALALVTREKELQ